MPNSVDIFLVENCSPGSNLANHILQASSQQPESTVVELFDPEGESDNPSSPTEYASAQTGTSHSSMQAANNRPQKLVSSALELFFELQYFSCLHPFSIHYEVPFAVSCLQNVLFWALSFLSFFDTIESINYNIVSFKPGKDVHRFIKIGMLVMELMVSIYHVKVLVMNRQKIICAIKQLDNLERLHVDMNSRAIEHGSAHSNRCVRFCVFSFVPIISSCLWGIFGLIPVENWNVSYVLYTSASNVGRTLFIWKPPENETASMLRMEENFLDQYDLVWILVGLLGVACTISARLHEYALRNLMISVELSLLRHTDALQTSIKARNNSLIRTVSNGTIPSKREVEKTWNYYFHIRKLSQDLDNCFGNLAGFVQFNNMLAIVYFVLLIILYEYTILGVCLFLYDIGLILFSFYCATKIAAVNGIVRKWIKNNTLSSSPIVVDGTTLQVLLDDIKETPIGIGSGGFFVDGGFMPRFFGLTASFLMYMVDAEEEPGR